MYSWYSLAVQRTQAGELYFLGGGSDAESGRPKLEQTEGLRVRPFEELGVYVVARRGDLTRGGLSAQPAILAEQVFEGNLRARLCLAIMGWTLKADDLSEAFRGGNILRFLDLE